MSGLETHITVIGAGLAGLSASLTLARAGVSVRLVSPQQSERAQSVLAEGGINAALDTMGEDDSPEEHYVDTMRGGVWLADPNAVHGLTYNAPSIVYELERLGAAFNRDTARCGGRLIQRNFGGQKKKRTAFAKSSTGKALVTSLIDALRKYEAEGLVKRFPHHEFLSLTFHETVCTGVHVHDVYSGSIIHFEGPVIIAAGGMGGLFGPQNTGTTQNTGDVAATLFAQGVDFANLEFIQYHPTTVPITGKRMLISEAARGEGGRLFTLRDGKPWYFMEERYPEYGNLMPRDVVSREEYAVLRDPACCGTVWLDMRHLSRATWEKISDLRDECIHYLRVDPAREPLFVEPGIHYCMGGIYVDEQHRCSYGSLYAAGECACQYHGANRLGGNSLLGAIYGGKVAATTALDELAGSVAGVDSADNLAYSLGASRVIVEDNVIEAKMQEIIADSLGIVRDADTLEAGLEELRMLRQHDCSARMTRRIDLAKAVLLSALERKESRGAHFRSDYPETSEEYRKTTVASLRDSAHQVHFAAIPELREER